MKIQKLPPEARAKLQSGVIITDTVQCVLELVRNSLDADASGIAVRVDLKNFHIKVIDNGKGIAKDDLELVGERFMTSKYKSKGDCNSPDTYGYKGQSISSMLDFCRSLTVKTKSENDGPALVKVFVKNKPGQITELSGTNSGIGTTVTLEDFMYTMPVRRKRIKEVFEMEEIKTQLQYLALIHYNVCFTLRNENKSVILLQTAQASSILEMISNLYGKTTSKSLKPVKYEEYNYKITGYVSGNLKQNNIQIVYVNREVIAKGVIHKFISNVLKEYNEDKTLLSDSPAEQILKKIKSSHYAFIIEIKCPHECYELFTNLRKTTVEFKNWKDVLKCIHRGLKKTYKFDSLDDTVNYTKDDGGKFGTSVLLNAVKGVPAMRGLKIMNEKKSEEVSKKTSFHETNKSEPSLIDSEKNAGDVECTVDTLETPIPKNRKAPCSKNSRKTSYIEFYKWLKASLKTDANAFNLYSEFQQYKSRKTINVYKSPVLGVKPKDKRTGLKSKIPEKKQKTIGSDILSKDIELMTQNSLKIFPNVDLRMKKAVKFNTEMSCDPSEFSNFKYLNWQKRDDLFMKPLFTKGRKQLEVIQAIPSPASSEIHFRNIIKFRNLNEAFNPERKEESINNTWMSHYQNDEYDVLHVSNTSQKRLKQQNEKKILRDVTIQTSFSVMPQKANAIVQTSQMIPETSIESEQPPLISDIPIPDFWNSSTPERDPFCNVTSQKQSNSSEFICAQKSKSFSNPKSNTETQTLPNLWTDSLSEFGNPAGQNAKPDSVPTTIPLEEICSSRFCLSERHDFVPKGLSPDFRHSEAVDIPTLDPRERNRIQLTIDDVKNELLTVKWQDELTGKCTKPEMVDGFVSKMQLNSERKSVNFESEILSASLSYCAIKVHNLLHSFAFTKELLSSVEVLGQLDEKFIIIRMKISSPKAMELISLLDQHAVDERIKLEKIISEYTTDDKFLSTALTHSLELTFSESAVLVIMDLKEKMSNFGFDIKRKSQEAVWVDSVPSFLLNKFKKENKKDTSLEDFLQTVILGIVTEITETRGAAPKIPKIIHDAFCSEACHSAIKFNKSLTKETMMEMMNNLKNCKLPFQCAHGRPSVIPIIDLEDFRSAVDLEEEDRVDLEKIRKFFARNDVVESSEGVK